MAQEVAVRSRTALETKREVRGSYLANHFLSLALCKNAPGVTRTPDPRIRNPLLYPAELRAHLIGKSAQAERIFARAFHGVILRSAL
jgi:hypothetical protein